MRKCLIWDFDGTLGYRAGRLWAVPLLDVIRVTFPASDVNVEQLRPHLRAGFPWHTPEIPHPELDSPDRWWEALYPVFERAYQAVGFDAEPARAMARAVREMYLAPHNWHLFDDTPPALEELARRGWTHVILSNHVPELRDIMRYLALDRFIARVFNSAETGYEKPHRRAFDAVLDAFPGPGAIWMIGDSLAADVAGAEAAGIPAVLVRASHETARHCCASLAELPAIVENRCASQLAN